ncbi:metalloregulator ArsR/SmtB family transcription factor [Paeniglutamicibacter sp. ABSL32-1]|uniref:ArsR/SmtB family transcription factor n=1 Tax=Paeniglutamicibacter quisquiliarum TaxID=2849498 RepID=UPI001C2D7C14|nr:metalloregulator ArsR/SmtB family transcription factor [Paeniglutamicibacter quisquiliarum]MBV1778948.1 metalloregulator ArsR/SmtB family transcription factor [Paeniglutamicibacter quisquiliarum]
MTMLDRADHGRQNALEGHAAAAALFHGLADPTRLMILAHLRTGEHKVKELTEHLGLAQSTVSAHLSCLRDCGLVTSRAQGRASLFSLANPQLLQKLLGDANHYIGISDGHELETHDFTAVHGPSPVPEGARP